VFTEADQIALSCGSLDWNEPSASAAGATTQALAATARITRRDMGLSYRLAARGAIRVVSGSCEDERRRLRAGGERRDRDHQVHDTHAAVTRGAQHDRARRRLRGAWERARG